MNLKKNALALAIITTLSACGSSDTANTAPTDIALSNLTVAENTAAEVVGTLSATDADSGDTFTYTVDDERFTISGNELALAADVVLDFEEVESIDVNVTVTDSESNTYSKALTIEVTDLLDTYAFDSKFIDDESAVSYSGQIARHVLIAELNSYIGNQLQTDLDDGVLLSRADVIAQLDKFFRTTELQYDNFPITFMDDTLQEFMTDISSSHKNLFGKLAGNDAGGQEKDWNGGDFAGWGEKGSITPTGLVDVFFGQLADNAAQYLNGVVRQSVTGDDITEIYLNADGTDLKQLIQKFLLVGITYSQATGDYLGEDTDGKGLTTDNTQDSGTKAYSTLEHQFDEGFGYFGAARDYLAYNDNEIAAKVASDDDGRSDWNGMHDSSNDGLYDLNSEVILGNAANAAKRDRGTVNNTVPTDFTTDIMTAFITGRNIINENAGEPLTTDQMASLLEQRDIAVAGWEKAIAATVVHYINDVYSDLGDFGTEDFNYADLAKHYSELKGFALGLQFNPYSDISDTDFAQLHTLLANQPALDTAENVAAYQVDLMAARAIIAAALSFDAENVENW